MEPENVQGHFAEEKYKGRAWPRKSDTADFLTKKQVEDHGEVPRYYVPDDHENYI